MFNCTELKIIGRKEFYKNQMRIKIRKFSSERIKLERQTNYFNFSKRFPSLPVCSKYLAALCSMSRTFQANHQLKLTPYTGWQESSLVGTLSPPKQLPFSLPVKGKPHNFIFRMLAANITLLVAPKFSSET